MSGTFRFYMTLGACIFLLPLKMIKGWNSELPFPLFSSWVADSCFLLWLAAAGIAAGGKQGKRKAFLGGALFFGLTLPALFVIASHSYFLEEATARQFSMFDVSTSAISFFILEVVPREILWGAAAALVLIALVAFFLRRRLRTPKQKTIFLVLGCLSALVLVHQSLCQFYPSVLWEVGRDIGEAYSHPAVEGSLRSEELTDAGIGRPADWSNASAFDKVVVFIMESVPLRELKERMNDLPADHFFNRYKAHTHAYTNYFTTNQDSRTGMLAMLFGRIIPFEAYGERDARKYLFLQNEYSLLNRLSEKGYETAVAAAQTDVEIVVFELPWKKKLLLSAKEFDNHGSYLCFNPYKFEHDCEDKILLPKIFEELDSQKRVFVMQEGVFGHIGDYYDATGKSSAEYYGDHLQAIADHLALKGDLHRTLLVVTSDHGIRDWEYREQRWVYRLPLLFINSEFTEEEQSGMYNQSDFESLLAAEMSGKMPPSPRHLSLFVGCTNSSIFGSISDKGDLLVVKNRKWRKYILANGHCSTDGIPDGLPKRPINPAALIDAFNRMQNDFTPDALGGVPN